MNGYKAAFYGTAVALAASLAFNVYARLEPPAGAEPATPTGEATDDAMAGEPAQPVPTAEDPRLAQLRTQLAACRETSWQVVAKAIQKDAQSHAKPQVAKVTGQKVTAADSSFEQQEAARCGIAMQFARLMLERDRAAFTASLKDVGSEAWQDEEVNARLATLEELFSLDGADSERLRQGYETLWSGYGREIRRLVEHEDWVGMVDASKTFWRDEDKLISDLLGPEARAEYRVAALDTRSALIATLAAIAGLPWDDKLAW